MKTFTNGLQAALSIVQLRKAHYELYRCDCVDRDPGNGHRPGCKGEVMSTQPATFAILDEIAVFIEAAIGKATIVDTIDIGAIEVAGDIGAIDVAQPRKELQLFVEHDGKRHQVTVFDDNRVEIDDGVYIVDMFSDTGRELIGYALRRAICRGIDRAEVVETAVAVTINLGKFHRG